LLRLGLGFTELPPFDWWGPAAPVKQYLQVRSTADDVWLIGWAQSELIELVAAKDGRKFGLVVGLAAGHLDPLALAGETVNERQRLGLYDKIFANSEWCKACISSAYPEIAGKVVVTGFPMDYRVLLPYRQVPKEDDLVVFNQRFALEKLHILELEVARLLAGQGFRVQHLSGLTEEELIRSNPALGPLLAGARQRGLQFVYNPDKHTYLLNLAKAATVITTPVADMLPVSLIEAIYLRAVPVAPRTLCFPEFVHPDNLYTPYDLTEVTDIVMSQLKREHQIGQYAREVVVGRMLAEMGLT